MKIFLVGQKNKLETPWFLTKTDSKWVLTWQLSVKISELPPYIEGSSMGIVDFDTWNLTKITITEKQFLKNTNCYYRIIEIPRDGFISLGMAIRGKIGIWLAIKVKSKGDVNPIIAHSCVT